MERRREVSPVHVDGLPTPPLPGEELHKVEQGGQPRVQQQLSKDFPSRSLPETRTGRTRWPSSGFRQGRWVTPGSGVSHPSRGPRSGSRRSHRTSGARRRGRASRIGPPPTISVVDLPSSYCVPLGPLISHAGPGPARVRTLRDRWCGRGGPRAHSGLSVLGSVCAGAGESKGPRGRRRVTGLFHPKNVSCTSQKVLMFSLNLLFCIILQLYWTQDWWTSLVKKERREIRYTKKPGSRWADLWSG